jgi:lipoyl(octanoyl) transferase
MQPGALPGSTAVGACARAGAPTGLRSAPLIKQLGRVDYRTCYEAMRHFTAERTVTTADELWIVEHDPVYTVGMAGRPEHFPRSSTIALEHIDRGGQITYHGPGQALVYTLIDLARRRLGVRELVRLLEQAVIDELDAHGVRAERRAGAPGVYVDGAKVSALGLRVRSGACYHGLALNVDGNLSPFAAIDPCGYPGLRVTSTAALGLTGTVAALGANVAERIAALLDEAHGSRR